MNAEETTVLFAQMRRAVLDLLARREHGRAELIRKLSARFPARELLTEVVGQLAEQGLQSDLRMAEGYVRARVARGFGPLRIIQELRQRGVQAEHVSAALDRLNIDWYQQLVQVERRKYGDAPPSGEIEKSKRVRFLQQRGFSTEQIAVLAREEGERLTDESAAC